MTRLPFWQRTWEGFTKSGGIVSYTELERVSSFVKAFERRVSDAGLTYGYWNAYRRMGHLTQAVYHLLPLEVAEQLTLDLWTLESERWERYEAQTQQKG